MFQILLLEGTRVPQLLKDVVSAPELMSILGPTPVCDSKACNDECTAFHLECVDATVQFIRLSCFPGRILALCIYFKRLDAL